MHVNLEIKEVADMSKKVSSKYRDYILAFSKITLSDMCKKLNINRSQIYNNELSEKKERLLQEEIEKELSKLYKNF